MAVSAIWTTGLRIVVRPGSIHCRWNIVKANRLRSLRMLSPRATRRTDWSDSHHADEQFHKLAGMASVLRTAVEVYHETLYAEFNPLPDRAAAQNRTATSGAVAALRAGNGDGAQ